MALERTKAAINKGKEIRANRQAKKNDCANCGKKVRSTNPKVNTCSKSCEGALLHKIMNNRVQ